MYSITYTKKFKKDYKKCLSRNYDINKLQSLIKSLMDTGTVPAANKPHKLLGDYKDIMECHIESDWLLLWFRYGSDNNIELVRTGTHSDLF